MSADNTNQSILILGGGCFGLATAFELAQKGYKNVTILEKDVDVPSRFSAAYDLNKVIRAEYADDFYTQLALVGTFEPRCYYLLTIGRTQFGNGNRIPFTALIITKLAF